MSRFRLTLACCISSALWGSTVAHAAGLTVAHRLDGYVCVGVAIKDQPGELTQLPPVYAEPFAAAAKVGVGQSSMIAVAPPKPVNGFVAVVLPNRKQGWISASLISAWHSLSFPRSRCYPALMSDGSWAFDYDNPKP